MRRRCARGGETRWGQREAAKKGNLAKSGRKWPDADRGANDAERPLAGSQCVQKSIETRCARQSRGAASLCVRAAKCRPVHTVCASSGPRLCAVCAVHAPNVRLHQMCASAPNARLHLACKLGANSIAPPARPSRSSGASRSLELAPAAARRANLIWPAARGWLAGVLLARRCGQIVDDS